ncbi:hypothetical protein MBLNU457_6980t1 [Dothideomycetes sp. NU457]
MKFSTVASALAVSLPIVSAVPTQKRGVSTTGTTHPKVAIQQDFADPSTYKSGNTWYAFASNNHKAYLGGNSSSVGYNHLINIQVATSSDFSSWTVTGQDALPTVGAWANPNAGNQGAAVWAPDVIQNAAGQYVMTYSAASNSDSSKHCIGLATSSSPSGPYTPQANSIACPLSQGGAIDSSFFKDTDGTIYMVYKIDGNSIGHGGSCNNGVSPQVPTPIMLQQLASDAMTPVGSPVQILDRSALDGPLIEAPALTKTSAGKYVLFFSSNCFASSQYDISYAFAESSITGPYTKRGPMMITGTNGLYSPGAADVAADGTHMVFHAGDVGPNNMWARYMYTQSITINNGAEVVSS